jgi:hypothetical protein
MVFEVYLKRGDSYPKMPDELLPPLDIAVIFNRSTATVINWARRGLLPGAVFMGSRLWFDRKTIEGFIEAGGTPRSWPRSERFTITRHGGRSHASGRPRNDRVRKPHDESLATLVKPDPGLRAAEFDKETDYSEVEPRRLLTGARTPDLKTVTLL